MPVSGEVVHLHWSPARVTGEVLGLDAAQPGLEAEAGVRRGEGVGVVRQRRHGRQDRRPRKPRGGGGSRGDGRGGGASGSRLPPGPPTPAGIGKLFRATPDITIMTCIT